MDQFFDKLGDWLKTLLNDQDAAKYRGGPSYDQDYKDAWDELDSYLKYGSTASSAGPANNATAESDKARTVPAELKVHFMTLGINPGSDFEEVKKAYKKLMSRYHPDRYAYDKEAQKSATEKTQAINAAYNKLESYFEKKNRL